MTLSRYIRKMAARIALKGTELPVIPSWAKVNWIAPIFDRLMREGYQANAAVFACITSYAFAFPEARMKVVDRDGNPLPDDPVQALLDAPNPDMHYRQLAQQLVIYLLIGGNAYLHKVRDGYGRVVSLYPYHIDNIKPVPSPTAWIDHFIYSIGSEAGRQISRDDIVHCKWPSVNPAAPWEGLAPILALAREIDTINEAIRYQYALLKNDAVPQTVFSFPAGADVHDDDLRQFKAAARQGFGGDGRGSVAVLRGGMTVQRIGLDFQELALDALSKVPEARIAAGFAIPPIVAGLSAGLETATYSNYAQARQQWVQNVLVPLWLLIADTLSQGLIPAKHPKGARIVPDLSKIVALQANADELSKRIVNEYRVGIIRKSEARTRLGLTAEEEDSGFVYDYPKVAGGEAEAKGVDAQVAVVTPDGSIASSPFVLPPKPTPNGRH